REKSREKMRGAGREPHKFGNSFPFRLPWAEAPLIFAVCRGKNRSDERMDAGSCGKNRRACYRVLLVRHGRRGAAAGAAGFGEFADFRLHVQRKIARDFSEGTRKEAMCGCGFGEAFPLCVPGDAGKREREFFGKE